MIIRTNARLDVMIFGFIALLESPLHFGSTSAKRYLVRPAAESIIYKKATTQINI